VTGPSGTDAAEPGADEAEGARPPLLLIQGDATAEEVAALVAVLQAAAAPAYPSPPPPPASEWSANHRRVRPALVVGRDGWRSSSLPR
jgi:hypothetical protein